MNARSSLLAAIAFLFTAAALCAQSAPASIHSTGGKSPHETTSTVIGDRRTGNRVTVTYGRPFLRDPKSREPRRIWGSLIPWGQAYRLGADEATVLITQKPLVFAGTQIPAGAYTLYLVPFENGPSRLAFSTALGKWGVPVDEAHDLARVDLARSSLDKPADQLTIVVANDAAAGGGVLKIMWETTQFAAPFTVAK